MSEPPHPGQRHERPFIMWPHFGQVMRIDFFMTGEGVNLTYLFAQPKLL